MNILLTNDDGYDSPGIRALYEALSPVARVWVVAPHAQRSGASHAITLHDPLRLHQEAERYYSCSGAPADCVLVALTALIEEKIDLVISGINRGPNLGTDIIYSGTAAAARQAALMNTPAVAVSLTASGLDNDYSPAAKFILENRENFIRLWHSDHFLNINVPVDYTGYRLTHPARRTYTDAFSRFLEPSGDLFFFLDGGEIGAVEEAGSDVDATENGWISLSPVFLHPQNHGEVQAYGEAEFLL